MGASIGWVFVGRCCGWTCRAWPKAYVEAFAFFGGTPRRLVPDNLRTGVDRTDLYDPEINRSYTELAAHYGTLVDPRGGASRSGSVGDS